LGVRVAYGRRSRIDSAILNNVVPKDSIIFTSDHDKYSELFFYDKNGVMKEVAYRNKFESMEEALAWAEEWDCVGNIIAIKVDGEWRPYTVTKEKDFKPVVISTSGSGDIGGLAYKSEVSSEDLSEELSNVIKNKANLATTLAGYGILDAHTKEEADAKFVHKEEGKQLIPDALLQKLNALPAITGVSGNLSVDENGILSASVATEEQTGLVLSSKAENSVTVHEDGQMEVNSLDMTKLFIPENTEIVFAC